MSDPKDNEYTLTYGPKDAVIVLRADGDTTAIIPHDEENPDEELSDIAVTAAVILCLLTDDTMIESLAKVYFEDEDLAENDEDESLTN